MALNRRAVLTDVQKELATTFIDINKAVGLITDTTVITELKRLYTTIEEVGEDFLTTSEAYAMAEAYFSEGATTLYLVPVTGESSGSLTTISIAPNDFIAITDGEFDVDVDSVTQAIAALDFTSIGNIQDIADVITAGLISASAGATCSVGIGNTLVITSDSTGVASIVDTIATPASPVGTDISALIAKSFLTVSDKDIIGKLTELENDSTAGFNFVVVGLDKALGLTNQVVGDGADLTQFVFNKEYDVFIDSSAAAVITSVTTDVSSTNKNFYDNLSGDDLLRVGNVSFYYTDVATDFVSFGVMGKLMAKDIGSQTVKFMKPKNSASVDMTNAELQNTLDKNTNVYTGTNERVGQSFIKEGTTLKDGDFVDTSLGSIWVKIQLDEAIYNLLTTKKVGINLDGFTLLENITQPVFQQAINQGIIDNNADVPFEIAFTAGNIANREIIGTYSYFEDVAGHFVTNTITIKTEA